nr:reverse transcriptase domain-containing protein [Tanacetum cinerariifolium]
MSTRSSARNLFPPLDNPELTIRRRPHVDPILLTDFEMATNGNGDDVPPPGGGDLPVPDLRTIEELCQPTLNGRGGPIALIAIQATKFGLKNEIIQQVQNSFQFNGLLSGTFMKRRLKECYDLIENKTLTTMIGILPFKGTSDLVLSLLLLVRASHGQNPPPAYQASAYQASGYQAPVQQALIPQPQVVTTTEFTNYMKANDAILKNMQTNMTSLTNSNLELKNIFGQFMKMNTASSSGSRTLPSNTITNPIEDLKGITTRSGNAYKGPTIPTTSSLPKVVKCKTEVTKDTVPLTNKGSTKDVQHPVVKIETQIPNSEPVVAPVVEPVEAPVSAMKPNPKPSIPYPSRLHDQKLRDKTNDQKEKFFKIFQDLDFNISFADALILMPKLGPTIKSLLTNKEKLFELARTPLNEHCLANKLSLPKLSPTCMTLELMDRSISRPVGVAEDVYVKVGTFHFLADFVVVDFDAEPRVSLILGRSFLKSGCALIDVYEGELTLQVLGFSVSGNPTPSTEPIVSNSSPTLTSYGDSDFLLKEIDAFLAIDDEPISPEIEDSYYDLEGDILLLEEFLNDDPSSPPLPPQELKFIEPTNKKSSIDEPPVVKLKDLPPHLEYVLKSHKQALAWQLSDIKGINLEFCTHKILIEDDFKPAVQHQRRVNPKIHKVIKKEVLKLLDAGLIYPVLVSTWVSPVHCVPKKGCFTIVENKENKIIPTRLVTGWCVCIDYRKLNDATHKDHFPLPFMDQMLERLAGNKYYCFLDGFLGYFQIPIDPQDQEKTTFTCPYGTFAYRRMPFRLRNAPGTFQRCIMAIFHDMIEKNNGSLYGRLLGLWEFIQNLPLPFEQDA